MSSTPLLLVLLIIFAATAADAAGPDRMSERVQACTGCHGDQGRAEAGVYYPSLAGKPAEYLYRQLRHFREGRRRHRIMEALLQPLGDAYLREIAQHFSSTPATATRRTPMPEAEISTIAERLVRHGAPDRDIPPCMDCHGERLSGQLPAIPGLLGLDAEYIAAQLGAWRSGVRSSGPMDCMEQIAGRLNLTEIASLAHWLAAQAVAKQAPEAPDSRPLSVPCESDSPLPPHTQSAAPATTESPRQSRVSDGEYLARAGNCLSCHTPVGEKSPAGGRGISTPFGTVYSSNLTPDFETGIGRWTSDQFHAALQQGVAPDGRLLYPAFPYPHYRHLSRDDSDAMFAYFRSLPPVYRRARPHALRFPFNTQWALWLWRTLFLSDTPLDEAPDRSQDWHRGRYLVEGLGHCGSCHGDRNALGGMRSGRELAGGPMPDGQWWAPSLRPSRTSSERQALRELLSSGTTAHQVATGPMAEVIRSSLQYLSERDIEAMLVYLDGIEPVEPTAERALPVSESLRKRQMQSGARIYQRECAGCHGEDGQGEAYVYPALAGNETVLMASPRNALRIIRFGGFAPSTQSVPYPFGMPPFSNSLNRAETAAVLTYIRNAWGNAASAVSPVQIDR